MLGHLRSLAHVVLVVLVSALRTVLRAHGLPLIACQFAQVLIFFAAIAATVRGCSGPV
jgi:hypothetical protein